MCNLLDGLVALWMHYAMRDMKVMGQQMGYRRLAERSHEHTYLGRHC